MKPQPLDPSFSVANQSAQFRNHSYVYKPSPTAASKRPHHSMFARRRLSAMDSPLLSFLLLLLVLMAHRSLVVRMSVYRIAQLKAFLLSYTSLFLSVLSFVDRISFYRFVCVDMWIVVWLVVCCMPYASASLSFDFVSSSPSFRKAVQLLTFKDALLQNKLPTVPSTLVRTSGSFNSRSELLRSSLY